VRAVLVSRYPRVDTLAWKRVVGAELLAAGADVSVLYSRASLIDQAWAGVREDRWGVVRRYLALRSSGADDEPSPTLAEWALAQGLVVERVRRLSDPAPLHRLSPDVMVLVGADIVPASLLAVPRLGTINAHFGMLPAYRGMNVAEWSIYHDDPVGVTIHLVDAGIDTGPILLRERITLEPGDTFASLRSRQRDLAAGLLVRAALELRDGTARPVPQAPHEGRQYYRMHPAVRRAAEARLTARARGARSSSPSSAAAASTSPSATWASHQRR
jgi:methionyl-tRNA formyltransferase